ncbi:MAG TPA: hypothetical protein VHV83_12110, partial [Armatimonadota bacterium]|nr:hypothetical protein [Armatimonadota bacterium]
SLIQEIAPDNLRGRIVSMWTFIFAGFTPIGSIYVGTVANISSPSMVLLISGIVCLFTIILVTIRAQWVWSLE